jgi:phosphatidylglycerophosphate synthase
MPPGTSHRRPIPQRSARWAVALARALALRGVSANAVSIAGMLLACVAGVCLYGAGHWPEHQRPLLAIATVLIPLRLICNLLDGMVAVEHGKSTPTGELFNEVPDRVSDTVLLIGAGYAPTATPELGYAAAVLALFVTYIRALGRGLGQGSDFRGPMAKQQRMWLVAAPALYLALAPHAWRPQHLMTIALAVISIGCVFTAARRLMTLARKLNHP